MIVRADVSVKKFAEPLWKESDELLRIFSTIIKNTKLNDKV